MNSTLALELGCTLDHVALAVNDLEKSVNVWESLGLHFSKEREIVPSQKVITAFAHIDTHAHLELLMPSEPQGAIYDFLHKKGEGIHHLSFKVHDIVLKMEELQKKGFQFIYPKPQIGANQCLVNFIHPKSMGGVLVEISQQNPNASSELT